MINEWLSDQEVLLGPAIALVLFLAIFIGMMVWIFRPGSRRAYEHDAQLPFDDARQAKPPRTNPRTGE
jgi:cbb3-type cytochrome oxidase subunit 3